MQSIDPEAIVICGSQVALGNPGYDPTHRISWSNVARRHQAGPQQQLPPRPRKTCTMIKHNEPGAEVNEAVLIKQTKEAMGTGAYFKYLTNQLQ